jgi:hypothetical protein
LGSSLAFLVVHNLAFCGLHAAVPITLRVDLRLARVEHCLLLAVRGRDARRRAALGARFPCGRSAQLVTFDILRKPSELKEEFDCVAQKKTETR